MLFAPKAYRTTRVQTTKDIEVTPTATKKLTDGGTAEGEALRIAGYCRMPTCRPLAVEASLTLLASPEPSQRDEKQQQPAVVTVASGAGPDVEKIGSSRRSRKGERRSSVQGTSGLALGQQRHVIGVVRRNMIAAYNQIFGRP